MEIEQGAKMASSPSVLAQDSPHPLDALGDLLVGRLIARATVRWKLGPVPAKT